MRWSFPLGRVYGVRLNIHATFFLILIWAAFAQYSVRREWVDALAGVIFILVLFSIVVLHELGHVLTARRFGIPTRDITLLPIGGVARLERMPEEPRQELLVALAGPAVNVALAIFFWALMGSARQLSEFTQLNLSTGGVLMLLVQVNVILAVFNLLPAFPMDGGRVLRALLAMWTPYPVATRVAAVIGKGMALLFIFLGLLSFVAPGSLFTNPFLLLIGFFVWIGAAQESAFVQMKSDLGGISAGQIMITDFRSLSPQDPLGRAAELLMSGWQQHFPVVHDGRLVGVLTSPRLLMALPEAGPTAPVESVMTRNFESVNPDTSGDAVVQRLNVGDGEFLPVTAEGNCVGILTRRVLRQYLSVRASLRQGYEIAASRP